MKKQPLLDQQIIAPKKRDLMFIGGGIANIWSNPHEEKFFYLIINIAPFDTF